MRFPSRKAIVPALVLLGITAGLLAHTVDVQRWEDTIFLVTLLIGSLPLVYEIGKSMFRGHFGIDIIAIVAIATSVVLGEYLAGSVILLMLSGGEALESFALRRARKDLTSLFERAPRLAHIMRNGVLVDIPAESVTVGDIVLVKPGEMIPVDGEVVEGSVSVDESFLTGESLPLHKIRGGKVMSGSVAIDGVLQVRTLKSSTESKYQQIIRLVKEAEEKKAPFVRLADRYSVWFTVATFLLAALAWILSHDPVRLLAVLVVATPCPLILATPIAFASGISRAAKIGIIVRSGGSLEKLGEARSFAFDKTGTLTLGAPRVQRIITFGIVNNDTVLTLAASLDQLSPHVLARSLAQEAVARGMTLVFPDTFHEHVGEGVSGIMQGVEYHFGRLNFLVSKGAIVDPHMHSLHDTAKDQGKILVFLSAKNSILGAVEFSDEPRPDAQGLYERLKKLGIERVLMLTGDRAQAAERSAQKIGFPKESVRAQCVPEQKVQEVLRLHHECPPVVMVGDGVNDAPAIAAADVGIAMGSHGSSATSEAGDIVILVDRIERVADALEIGQRVLRIAKESVFIGMGLSIVLMIIASLGYIAPLAGALMQEVIDVIVILNALRALRR